MDKDFYKNLSYKFSILIAIIILLCGCGRKALPVPPGQKPPPTVNDLSSNIEADMLRLTWTVSETNKRIISNLDGIVVYRSKTLLSEPDCKGCPVLFKRIADIPIEEKDVNEKITYKETLANGYKYIYKVTVYTKAGVPGKDSNYIEFDH